MVNVLTCDYIDFYKLVISHDKKTCETDAGQNQCTHMWLHWHISLARVGDSRGSEFLQQSLTSSKMRKKTEQFNENIRNSDVF